ncbi:DNA phosphorothioation-dependent restriction protein DptH [Bacillus lacus]|uniref:DNA phosphorothioation-dependent restriction protein DptH n=1 Tax=Metabacillus lacus TaxID=1983721 RepID=A0A7X2J084_9BACI|nr:DNA phosphorothioation-dependent restriction protein DptH [Metabacillus lacus]MRX73053.1 DNA phosphorothioation-dependent restriction protein DptH [Metabacillus lacus]
MSNQFYNYIASILKNFFKESGINNGDRYYLQLDSHSDVEALVDSLKNIESAKKFEYKHEMGEKYVTFSIPFQERHLVVAHTSASVKPDFLVTLRNLVGEQTGEWKDTALLSIVSEQLDSIQGGSSDLQKEGMPLHPSSIFKNLKFEIEHSVLEKVDRIILMDNLEYLMKEQSFQQITIFEFEDIFSTLEKGSINDNEYYKYGIFKDPDLDSFKGKEQQARINENRELYDFVRKVHDFGLGEDELEKRFTPQAKKGLMDEDWKQLTFPKVHKYHQDYLDTKKGVKVELEAIKISDRLINWNRPLKETAAGNRKRHIIIFNPENKESINLQISFELNGGITSLSKEFLTVPKEFDGSSTIEVKKTNIFANIKTKHEEVSYLKLAYKHDKKSTLGAELSIAVLPIDPIYLDKYKSTYTVDPILKTVGLQYEEEVLTFGQGMESKKLQIESQLQTVMFTQDQQVTVEPLPESFNDEDELIIKAQFDNTVVLLKLKNELPESMPITGQRLWKLIRETSHDVKWIKENNRLILENREFYFHSEYKQYFEWENQWVEQGIKHAYFESDQLIEKDVVLKDELREAFSRFINYFKRTEGIPSLSAVSNELRDRSIAYIKAYLEEIKGFVTGTPAGKKGMDLFKLGTLHSPNMVYFTPFHPLMVAYKLKVYNLLGHEEIDNSILNRLSPDALVPFLYNENERLYKPDYQQSAMEWLTFKPVNQVSVSDANQYLAKVVSDKISQFKDHFSYLFIESSMAPLQINIINIVNDKEVLKGIIHWMLKVIEREGIDYLKPVEVTLYNDQEIESAFDLYARTETVEKMEELFDIKLKKKDLDEEDVLRKIRQNLFFYKQLIGEEYKYAHISFYKMKAQEKYAVQPMKDMTSGIALDGLYSSVPSMKDQENYKSGFGTQAYSIDQENLLASTSYYVNELAANLRNSGNDSYRKEEVIFSRTTTTDEENLEKIFKSSYWVTFVDPSIDLEYFNQYDGNLVVIHYSDQYSSSSRYDAITVTDKSQQYYAVIKEFLAQKNVEGTDENVLNTIKAFNTFNGEWLLRIIGSKGHYDREKLSIISAIKFSVSYFDHPNITWVPISLEEVLRVAGAVSLSKSDGIFTAKNLGVKGSHSDDLLLIGLEQKGENISLHFYPVEVKIGFNKGTVLDKARKQVKQTKQLFVDTLTGETGETFTGKFYRNFFAQLLISNAQKLQQSDFWTEKGYALPESSLEKLLKDDYTVSNRLSSYIGDGAILSFQKDAHHRSAAVDSEVLLLNLTESDGYEGLVRPIKELRKWIQEEENDFVKEDMLSYSYKQSVSTEEQEISEQPESTSEETVNYESADEHVAESYTEENNTENEPADEHSQSESENPPADQNVEEALTGNDTSSDLEDTRILLGKAENSNRNIYWEFGNKGLANRHLLISGKSGQGKTYFMQCLLLEKSKMGIPSIIIDYTEGFLPNQLEEEFVTTLGPKLKQKIVYSEKLPINPFEKNVRDIGGIQLPESNTDIAERVKSVFASVYKSLGIQQQNAIYEAILNGLERYDDKMSLVKLKEMLEEDGSNYSKTALSQIRPLIDRDPFSTENTVNWKDIVNSNGEIYIIQLTGFPRDVQLMITEFILWDMWNYSVKHGSKNHPMPVIMDEAQNLDHTEKSPSARILTEGRKFGWSGWYATQFLKSQLDPDELARLQNSSQKVYFSPPEQEISSIAGSLSKDNNEKKQWENKLASLKKGQCIVHGPVLKDNGELSNPTVTVVDITSLSERL